MKEPWEQYTYRVFWSPEDEEYVGVCAELPGLSWLDKDPQTTFLGIRQAAQEGIALLREHEDPIPQPLATRAYSGSFKVRIPPEVHRGLVLEAAEQRVSLNRLVSVKLAQSAVQPVAVSRKNTRKSSKTKHARGTLTS
ncbi:MAG TPA: toxin-antitoxin system HicB family antitoxin [Thermoanaerobaculia bacterium]